MSSSASAPEKTCAIAGPPRRHSESPERSSTRAAASTNATAVTGLRKRNAAKKMSATPTTAVAPPATSGHGLNSLASLMFKRSGERDEMQAAMKLLVIAALMCGVHKGDLVYVKGVGVSMYAKPTMTGEKTLLPAGTAVI